MWFGSWLSLFCSHFVPDCNPERDTMYQRLSCTKCILLLYDSFPFRVRITLESQAPVCLWNHSSLTDFMSFLVVIVSVLLVRACRSSFYPVHSLFQNERPHGSRKIIWSSHGSLSQSLHWLCFPFVSFDLLGVFFHWCVIRLDGRWWKTRSTGRTKDHRKKRTGEMSKERNYVVVERKENRPESYSSHVLFILIVDTPYHFSVMLLFSLNCRVYHSVCRSSVFWSNDTS